MKGRLILRLFFIVCFCLGLGQANMEVQAANCEWTGNDSNWNNMNNWSCSHIPTVADDVIIPDVTNDPIISSGIEVNSITVENGAVLTINNPKLENIQPYILTVNEGGSVVALGETRIIATTITNDGMFTANNYTSTSAYLDIRSTTFTNEGTFQLSGDSYATIMIRPESWFNNSGIVSINAGHMALSGVGTHSGNFLGAADTSINFTKYGTTGDQTVTFEDSSVLDVPTVGIGTIVDFNGVYGGDTPSIENELSIQYDGIFQIQSGSVIKNLDQIEINEGGEVINDNPNHFQIQELIIHLDTAYNTTLQNNGSIEILDNFEWQGTLTGTGTTEIAKTSSVFIQWKNDPISLDGHHLINQTTFNWYGEELALSNGAIFTNNGTFNAYENSTLSGGSNGRFINNGLFTKNGSGTTTTVNTDFEKNGNVNIVSGSLIFTGNLIYGSSTTLELGSGAFYTGETLVLEAGAKLVGSGTLSSNLVNGGTVSPGTSPGLITVVGDYTQESDGVLEIELGGDEAGTGYDQLQVSGAATLAGSLNVSSFGDFVPTNGDQFLILDAESLSGTFTTINFPTLTNGLEWQTEYTATGFTISAVSGGTINGTVTYTGTTYTDPEIIIGLHSAVGEEPEAELTKYSGDPYSFEGLADGTYYISAFIDADSSGGAPDSDEPFGWYVDQDGDLKAVEISGGNTINDVDIALEDVSLGTGTITGTVNYTGSITTSGNIIVSLHDSASLDQPPLKTTFTDITGNYTFENLSDGTYYVAAFLDVNDSGDGPPDDGEPFSWYVDLNGDPKAVVISDGHTVSDVDITLEDSTFKIFLPLILK